MEILSFSTSNVENKLNDICGAIEAMKFAVEGLRFRSLINDSELNGLYSVLKDAGKKAESLAGNLKPVLIGDGRRIVLVFCEGE